ncbi:hypothetical protein AB3X93_44950, partial [Paraburkholderia sp. BR14262]
CASCVCDTPSRSTVFTPLAAFEGAQAVSPEHVDEVADCVLAHRRHAMPQRSDVPSSPETQPPASPRHEDKHTETSSDADWGELPPEPVAAKAVKGVIPLPAKKR